MFSKLRSIILSKFQPNNKQEHNAKLVFCTQFNTTLTFANGKNKQLNCVLYLLDLPGIVSGNKIGFLDPHKECFGNGHSGKRYDIESSLLDGEIRDQFKPFQGVFDFDFDFYENYESTLFRFPLRTCLSKLSQTEYTKEKVDKLFESLREEASIILLFMKNIQHISVYERVNDGDEAKRIFKVEIAPEMCEMVKQLRTTDHAKCCQLEGRCC